MARHEHPGLALTEVRCFLYQAPLPWRKVEDVTVDGEDGGQGERADHVAGKGEAATEEWQVPGAATTS